MIKLLVTASILLLLSFNLHAIELKTEKQKLSYSIGLKMGQQFVQTKDYIDTEFIRLGMQDMIERNKFSLSNDEINRSLKKYGEVLKQKGAKLAELVSKQNIKEAKLYFSTNKTLKGIVTLPSGLQYKIIKKGTGKRSPSLNDIVVTNYSGKTLDGKVFDSSYVRGKPVTFPVNGVIKGWTEALQLMKVGDVWQIYVPSKLAYGKRGAGPQIGPDAALIFDIELLDIK